MGNKSSKQRTFCCCPCTFTKSSSSTSLSIEDKYLPTFDRLTSNDKVLPTQHDLPRTILSDGELEKNLLTSNNRRSVSLHNVILTLPTNDNAEQAPVHSKPPLPPGKSVTVSKLPPTGRSFRGTLGNSKRSYYSQSIEHARLSIEDLEKSLQGAASIDQWIDSLPVLGTPSLNRNKTIHANRAVASTNNKKIKRSHTVGDEYTDEILNGSYREEKESLINTESNVIKDDYPNIFTLKFNREFLTLAKQIHLNMYIKDFFLRLKSSKIKQTLKNHFSSSTIIYPMSMNFDQTFADDLHLDIFTPIESILPTLSVNKHSTYKIHEQLRSKCYFIPQTNCKIEVNDEEYQRKCIELDRTHVVISLDTQQRSSDENSSTKKTPIEPETSCVFISDHSSFHQGFLRIEQDKLAKHFLPFIYHSIDDDQSYLSSNLIQQWLNTLLLVNQTCTIAQRFLIGDGSHITCSIKQQQNFTFTALRLPPYMHLNDSISSTIDHHEISPIVDAFSSRFLSDNKSSSNDTIHIDYEQYSFAFQLHRWPKNLLESYSIRARKWPSKYHLNILIKKPLLLIPIGQNHQWELNFDPIERDLFELMNETTFYFYSLCQQLFTSSTQQIRICLKHCFLNYCETYGLPFSNQREHSTDNLRDLLIHFLKDIQIQLNTKSIRHYFDHEMNLYENTDTFQQWLNSINLFLENTQQLPTINHFIDSNRSIIVEFLFYFIDQLYQTFHIKRSQFHLNENVLLDLHKQLCEKLSNDTNNNSTFINHLLNNQQILEYIQTNLMFEFETNAELVHTCLNQVRKADSSLIFHYTWTIFIQYLHTYYNTLWNI